MEKIPRHHAHWELRLRDLHAGPLEDADLAWADALLDLSRYASHALQVPRGCPFQCEFCDCSPGTVASARPSTPPTRSTAAARSTSTAFAVVGESLIRYTEEVVLPRIDAALAEIDGPLPPGADLAGAVRPDRAAASRA